MFDLFSFVLLNIFGVMSPGPDFAVVTKYGLSGSRKAALQASLGVGAALLVHVFYCVSGVAFFLQSSFAMLLTIKILGALYLSYLGLQILFTLNQTAIAVDKSALGNPFAAGFFTNLLNPKATIFLLSLFTLFSHAMDSWSMKLAFASSIPLVAVGWFSLLSVSITHPSVLPFLQKKQRAFMALMGLFLVILGGVGVCSSCIEVFQRYF